MRGWNFAFPLSIATKTGQNRLMPPRQTERFDIQAPLSLCFWIIQCCMNANRFLQNDNEKVEFDI